MQPAAAVVSERPFSDLQLDCGQHEWFADQFRTTKHTDGGIYNDLENLSTEGFSALMCTSEIDFLGNSSRIYEVYALKSPPVPRGMVLLSESTPVCTVFPISQD